MSENRMKDRVKVLLNGVPDGQTSEHAPASPQMQPPPGHQAAPGQQGPQPQQGVHPNQALQVLTLAQRTAEEHVARAHHQADKIRTDALAAAEQIARDAQVHAHNVRREADKILADARTAAEQIARDSHARTEETRRSAEKILADARTNAGRIADDARKSADHLNQQARQRYDDVVGSLGTKRESLQQQIEALELFDREYRSRLTTFMQTQLRSLWVDQPQVNGDLPEQPLAQTTPPTPADAAAAPRHGADEDTVPTQRQSHEDEGQDEDEKEAGQR